MKRSKTSLNQAKTCSTKGLTSSAIRRHEMINKAFKEDEVVVSESSLIEPPVNKVHVLKPLGIVDLHSGDQSVKVRL